jgi:hypothetical protein
MLGDMKMSTDFAIRSKSMPDLTLLDNRQGKMGGKTYTEKTTDSSAGMLSIGAAAASAFSWAYSSGAGATAATHTLGALSYAKLAPVGVFSQYAAANATSTAASAAVTGTSLGVAANCAVGLAVGGAVLGAGILGYNMLIAKTDEDKISLTSMARYGYNALFG